MNFWASASTKFNAVACKQRAGRIQSTRLLPSISKVLPVEKWRGVKDNESIELSTVRRIR